MNVMTAYKEMIAGRLSEAEFLRIKAEAFSDGGTRKTCPRCGNVMFEIKDRFGRFEQWQCGADCGRDGGSIGDAVAGSSPMSLE